MFKQRRSLNVKMENSWNSSRRIFLHVGCDVASFLLPSKALLCCCLCPASSLSLGVAEVWEKQGHCSCTQGAQGLCGTRRRHTRCGVEETNGAASRGTAQGKGKPGCFAVLVEIGAREEAFSKTFSQESGQHW